MDCEKGEGIELAKKYNIRGYPTFYLINSQEQPIFVFMGYAKEYWTEKMNQALSDLSTIAEKKEKFEKQPDETLARMLADYAYAKNELEEAFAYLKKVKKLNPHASRELNIEMFQIVYSGYRANQFTLDTLKATVKEVLNDSLKEKNKANLLFSMARLLPKAPDDQQLIAYLQDLIKLIRSKPDILRESSKTEAEILNCLYVEKDVKKALQKKKATLPQGWQENANQLNAFAWWCFENQVNLEEAEQLARKAVALATSAKDRANILDTLAEILSLRGKHQEAINTEKKALELDPQRKLFKQNLERFKERAGL